MSGKALTQGSKEDCVFRREVCPTYQDAWLSCRSRGEPEWMAEFPMMLFGDSAGATQRRNWGRTWLKQSYFGEDK